MPSIINAATSGGLISTADTSGVLQLQTASTNALSINASQQVQVNTGGSASAPVISKSDDTNTGIFFPAADTIAFTEGGAESMRIDSSGNVGIGTSSPSCKLDLNRGSAGLLANFTDGVNTNFQIGTTSLLATIGPSAGSTAMAFKTGDTERMRITSAGDVGIGNTAPGAKLEVTGAIRSLRTGSTAAILQVINDNNSWNITSGTSTSQFRIDNNLVGTALTINNNGAVALAGASQTASGVGITFPATQSASSNANTLDDYEEGTWSPTITNGYTSPTYSTQAGTYTKVGRIVNFALQLRVTGGTRTASILQISLPFTSAVSSGNRAFGAYWTYADNSTLGSLTTNVPFLFISNNGASISFYNAAGGTYAGNDLTTATPEFYISGHYITD